jgi:nucleotide-binding universal stress UspA family protein
MLGAHCQAFGQRGRFPPPNLHRRRRVGAALTIVAACGEKKLNLDELRTVEPNAEIDHRPAVEALVARAAEAGADLLVVGSRGLHGVKALGSVSERVAHRAGCSVLVVRETETEME